jgi:hypothetical protein
LPMLCSRFALVAGEPPAVPVKSLDDSVKVTTKGPEILLRFCARPKAIGRSNRAKAQLTTLCSRFALVAGGPPAVPVKRLDGLR